MTNFKSVTLSQLIQGYVSEKLEDYKGQTIAVDELSFRLTENENKNCSFYCSAYKAKQDIIFWFDDLGEIMERLENDFEFQFDMSISEMFNDIERFHLQIVLLETDNYLMQLPIVSENENDFIELTDENIRTINEQLSLLVGEELGEV